MTLCQGLPELCYHSLSQESRDLAYSYNREAIFLFLFFQLSVNIGFLKFYIFLFFFFIQQVLISYLFYTYQCIYVNPNLPIHPTSPMLSLFGVHTFVLYICVQRGHVLPLSRPATLAFRSGKWTKDYCLEVSFAVGLCRISFSAG